jgi:hypothetical protein
VFKNAGVDFVNLGRPANIVNLLAPTTPHRVTALYYCTNTTASSIIGLTGGAGSEQFNLFHNNALATYRVGGITFQVVQNASVNTWVKVVAESNGTQHRLTVNNETPTTFGANGTELATTQDILMGRRPDGTIDFEGSLCCFKFETFEGGFVDMLDFNDQTQWSGGLSGVTAMGNPFTITDGSPTGVRVKDLVPWSLLS